MRLTPARAAELRERLTAVADEFDDDPEDDPDGAPVGLLIALYPIADSRDATTEEPSDD